MMLWEPDLEVVRSVDVRSRVVEVGEVSRESSASSLERGWLGDCEEEQEDEEESALTRRRFMLPEVVLMLKLEVAVTSR